MLTRAPISDIMFSFCHVSRELSDVRCQSQLSDVRGQLSDGRRQSSDIRCQSQTFVVSRSLSVLVLLYEFPSRLLK